MTSASAEWTAPDLTVATIAVLSFSRIARDIRVLRQCALIEEMGTAVHVVALANDGDSIPYKLSSFPTPQPTAVHRLSTVLRQVPAHLPGLLGDVMAERGFWAAARHRWALNELRRLRPTIVLANDWQALVVAARCRAESGALVHYDTHEFATQEFDERVWWRLAYKPFVTRLEARHIMSAVTVSTVGPLLAKELQALYRLAARPSVIRNIPERVALPEFVETQWPLRILYLGHILPNRGLETLIESIPLWREPHRLTIRGEGRKDYVASLKAIAEGNGHGGQVRFEAPVPPDQVVPVAAASADLGVFFTPLDSVQQSYTMPNKLFEYISAGLAVAVSPGPDLRTVVEGYRVGVVSADAGSKAIADAINGLTRDAVAAWRINSAAASAELCWKNEKQVLAGLLTSLLAHAS